jgi:hypothetical protein
MERLPSHSQAKRLYEAAKNLASMAIPHAPLCQSDHYNREHFIPFEDGGEALPPKYEQPELWDSNE